MLYSSSFDALKKCLVGVQKYIQANIIILPAQPASCLYTNPGHRRVRGFRRGNWAAVEENWSYMRWSSLISLLLIISILEILFINNFLYHFTIRYPINRKNDYQGTFWKDWYLTLFISTLKWTKYYWDQWNENISWRY